MAWSLIIWSLCFIASFVLIFFTFHQLLYLTDLEADTMNIFDATVHVNRVVLPEIVLQGVMSLSFLLTGHGLMFLLSCPVTCIHLKLFLKRQHLIDVTEVFRTMNFQKKLRIFKLIYYFLFASILIIRIIAAALPFLNPEELDIRSPMLDLL